MDILKSGRAKNFMVDVATKNLKKDTQKELVDADILKKTETKEFSVKSLLSSLFKDLSTQTKSKDVVLQILKDKNIAPNIKDTVSELKSIIDSLKNSDISTETTKNLDKLLLDIDKLDAKSLQVQIKNSGIFLESKLANADFAESLLPRSAKETLQNLKGLSRNVDLKINTALIDKILNSKVADKSFIEDIKTLIGDLKNFQKEPLVQTTAKLEILLQKNQILESKTANSILVSPNELKSIMKNIEQNLGLIKVNNPAIQEAITSLNFTLRPQQNLKIDISSVGEKLQFVVNLLKSELSLREPKAELYVEVAKLTNRLASEFGSAFKNGQITLNQSLQVAVDLKKELSIDIKANLLQIREELAKNSDMTSKNTLSRVDKVLTNIIYYQLSSFGMGANVLYLPLLWDGLEEGRVSIKKLKQKRFFCEINLKLKDFGKIDLLVMLFDDIYINISIFTQNSEFLGRIKDNLQLLRQGISSLSLVPSNIYLYDSLKDGSIKKETKEYIKTQQVGTGISIHV